MAVRTGVLLFTTYSGLAISQATNYSANAETSLNALQTFYNTTSGLWNTAGWWNGANAMTAVADLAAADSSVLGTAETVFTTTFANAPPYNPSAQVFKISRPGFVETIYGHPAPKAVQASDPSAWLDSCYDDNGWWALAWIAAWDLTKNDDYLSTAEGIFANMSGSWPSNCNNGGIYWCTTSTYVNAIANELFLSVAAHLANRVSGQTAYYVDWAQREWAWFQSVNMINSAGVIVDGLNSACTGDPTATVWSYNQGVILGGLVELATADSGNASSYLASANSIANAAISNLTDSNGIIHDVCEPNCGADGTQFKGVFMRNLLKLHQASPSDRYKQLFETNAQSVWNNDRDDNNLLSVDWAGPFVQTANSSTHSSAMDALIAAAVVG